MHEISTLKNGIRVVNRHLPQSSSVAIAVFVATGGRYEDFETNYGVTHFLEHLLFKGTKKRPNPKQIPEEIDGIGGYINAYTAEDRTCYYVKLPRQHWVLGLDVLVDLVQNPLFSEKEIDRERGVILEEMNVRRDDPAGHVFELVGDLLWPNDNLRTNVIGTEQIISSITKSQIASYYKTHYGLNNIVISIAGNLEQWEIIEKLEELLISSKRISNTSFDPTKNPMAKHKVSLLEQDTNQAHLVVATRGAAINSVDEVPLRILTAILGAGMSSRLSLNVREKKGLAYTIFASSSNYTDSGSIDIYAGVNKGKIIQALRAIATELAKLRDVAVAEKELNKVKELIKGRIIMSQEENSNIADRAGTQMILTNKITPIEETIAKIEAVGTEDVARVANKYLASSRLHLAVIGPYTDKDKARFEQALVS